ncbi:MAG: pyruvate, phosphate dikinase [Alphaproteobacteria bacterium]|nr:pyruvate, phosphate dikinase [Alphaproteobacteria bacterium]
MSRPSRSSRHGAFSVFRIPFEGEAGALPTKELVGSKAHNLMRMARCGLPVPPGFVLGTDLWRAFSRHGRDALHGFGAVLAGELEHLAGATGRRFGDARRPLLVSVRSGAAVSMPGMMETVLNVGLTRETLRGVVRSTGNPRLAYDCLRRFIQQFAEVVHGVSPKPFDEILRAKLAEDGLSQAEELDSEALRVLAGRYEECFETAVGRPMPADPLVQLEAAIDAVLRSWMSERARSYRALNAIADDMGTATIVQAMVFGNAGPDCGSGVGFTRSPADGGNALYVDYLPNAQGEDVVAGRRNALGAEEFERRSGDAYRQLLGIKDLLEREFADMQDFEFTVENGRLHMLQSRTGKRTPLAAMRIARDLVAEQVISPGDALARLAGIDLDAVDVMALDRSAAGAPIARAVAASTGVVVGVAVFDPGRVHEMRGRGKPVVLMREHAETGDIAALAEADALITAHGARTSHAAVVARQLGKVCLVGCASLRISPGHRGGSLGGVELKEGDLISADGGTGEIFLREMPVVAERPDALIATIRSWHAQVRPSPDDASPRKAGAKERSRPQSLDPRRSMKSRPTSR